MGCFWSCEDGNRCMYCNRREVNNLILIDNVCEICACQPTIPPTSSYQLRPRFGEYRCSCGRFWTSRLSWARAFQVCKRCRKQVYPYSQRDLQPGDHSNNKDSTQEHQRDYCQMCQQLGYYCGNYIKNNSRRNQFHISL